MGKGGHALKCGIQAKEVNQAVYAAGYFPCTLGAELVCTVHVRAFCVKHLPTHYLGSSNKIWPL